MIFTMSLNFRLICYEWQGLTASVLPDRRRRLPATATATGNGDADGKVNDKSTLSHWQAVRGADTKRRAMKKRTRTRARGQGLDNWGRRRGGPQGVE